MPSIPRILAATALCLAAVGVSSCICNPRQTDVPVSLSTSAKEESAHSFCCATSVDEQKHIYSFKFVLCDGNTPIGTLTIPLQEMVENERLTGISVLSPTFMLERKYDNLRFVYAAHGTAVNRNGTYRGDIDICFKIHPTVENAGTITHCFGFVYKKGEDGQVLMRTAADNVPFDVPENVLGVEDSIWTKEVSLQFCSFEK